MGLGSKPPKVEAPQAVIEPVKPDEDQIARQRTAVNRRKVDTSDLFIRPIKTGISP